MYQTVNNSKLSSIKERVILEIDERTPTCLLHLANDIRIFAFFLASIFIGRRHSTPANATAFHVPASWHTLGKKFAGGLEHPVFR